MADKPKPNPFPVKPDPETGQFIGPPTLGDINKGDGEGTPAPSFSLDDPVLQALLAGFIGGGSGSGGGSSSGGGGGPPADPQLAEATAFYVQLWGKPPPNGYVQHFLDGTTDVFDFIRFQLSRPGARKTRFYANALASYAAQAASIMGRR